MSRSAAMHSAVRRNGRLLWLVAALSSIVLPGTVKAQEESGTVAPAEFRAMVLASGLSEGDFASFEDWNGELSAAQAATVAKLLFRLNSAEPSKTQARPVGGIQESDRPQAGGLVRIEGRAVSAVSIGVPAGAQDVLDENDLTVCQLKVADGSEATVLSLHAPKAWSAKDRQASLDEPVKLRGVLLGSIEMSGAPRPLVLADRIEWYPESNVSAGVAWLVQRGFDAALLDEVRHGMPFAKPHESLEARAFYTCLAIIAQGEAAELTELARNRLPAAADAATSMAADAAERRRELSAQLESASAVEKPSLRTELDELRRVQAMANQVGKRAEKGLSSVWPMFLDPAASTGELFLIEGTARRAVRIVVNEPSPEGEAPSRDADDRRPALREYYEVDVFTTDSQNQPVICCVARLPAGFPTGELIREPVRVAGIFFKKWAYARRADDEASDGDRRAPRIAPPLMLAAAPEWLKTPQATTPDRRGLWGGGAFVVVLALLWIVLARVARRDRLARAERARYDATLENLAEP